MIRLRVFVVLAITLFLTGFVSAQSAGKDENSKEKAESDVAALQKLTAGVVENAEKISSEAESVKTSVEEQKRKADSAELAVKTAEESIKATNRKAEAALVVQETERELGTWNPLYEEAKSKADTAFTASKEFVTKARTLDNKAKTEIQAALSSQDTYAQAIESAKTATSDTTELSGQIEKSTLLAAAKSAFSALQAGAKKVQMLKYKAESIAVVSRIEAMVSEAATVIQSIEEKKDKIDTIVQAMNTKCEIASGSLKSSLSPLCNNARGYLQTATNKVTETQKYNDDVQGKKTQADNDFSSLVAATEEDEATEAAGKITQHETYIDSELQKIKQALGAVDNAFSSSKRAQQQMQNEIEKKKSQPGSEPDNEKQQDNLRTTKVTNPIRSGEAKTPAITKTEKPSVTKTDKPAITETDKRILGKSEDTMEKTLHQPIDAHLDKTKEQNSMKLTDKEKKNPKDDNSVLLNNDKLRNITKDITTNSLIGGEVPTRSAANDTAVTVFIPLLVILVISAVLH